MDRIKCPYCGSTSQPELIWEDRNSYGTKKVKEYICGCGCRFEAVFELKEINILENEK
jgi:hypothetical protein